MKKASIVRWLALGLCLVGGIFIASCALVGSRNSRVVSAASMASIPGAKYVGMETCAICHAKQTADFRSAPHSAFMVDKQTEEGKPQVVDGCETCHGPGSLHVDDPSNKSKILVGDYRACFACHLDKRTMFSFRYHHPVPEGRMSCTACHDPHETLKPVERVQEMNDKCFKCHPEIRGPWTFPHEAVTQDGCTVCHNPHGTHLKKMLVANPPNLCLRCHFDEINHPAIADANHGKPTPTGSYLRRGCMNCHRGIHGSNFSSERRSP